MKLSTVALSFLAVASWVRAEAATLVVTNSADSGAGSLRQAILDANANVGSDVVNFNLPSGDPGFQAATGHWRIDVTTTALPAISDALTIDGYSQPGALPNTNPPSLGGSNAVLKIELRNATGLTINGIDGVSNNFLTPLVVRGLTIHSFTAQIQLGGGAAQRVEGCFIGTTIDGSQSANNSNGGRIGIRVQGSGAFRIGGLMPDTRNVISGQSDAISFFTVTDGARIEGNLIGTNAAGTAALSPRAIGISSGFFPNLIIGGADPNARNLISGNGFWGLLMNQGNATTAKVLGNYIGTDWTGTRAIGNGLNPLSPSQRVANVQLSGATCPVQLGGGLPGETNLIAFGGDGGVVVDQCTNAPVQRNRFIANNVAAIDNTNGGGARGLTPNDPGDADTGGNRLQNFPDIVLPSGFAPGGGANVTLSYRVDSALANASYPINVEFYRAACGGGGEGTRLASDSYLAAEAGASKSLTFAAPDNVLPLVAVAVDALGNTSEFSPVLGDSIFRADIEDSLAPELPGVCR